MVEVAAPAAGSTPSADALAKNPVTPSATSPGLSTAEDDGLFFRTAPSDARQGEIVRDILTAAGLAPATMSPLVVADWTDAHRPRRSGAVWDVVFNAATDLQGPLVPWMASVEYTGTLDDPGGGSAEIGPTTIVLP